MSRYRRLRIEGGSYFFTVALADRSSDFLITRIDLLRDAYRRTWAAAPFTSNAFVVLPDHLHAVWTLPKADADYSGRWARFKSHVSRHVDLLPCSESKRAKREKGLWQRRFWARALLDEADFRNHVEYCWLNPVKHGLVATPEAWPYSSLHRDIRSGVAPGKWRTENDCRR